MPSSADIRYAYEQIVQHGHCECVCGRRFLTEDGYALHLDRDDCGNRTKDKAEVARLQALLAERDAEDARHVEPVRDAIDCLERALGAQRPYSLTRTREIRLALDTLRSALAARGGEVQG